MNDEYRKVRDFFLKEGFYPLDSKSYPLLRKYNHCSPLQEKNGLLFVTWQHTYFGLYKIINECICSVFFHEGRDIYWTIHRPRENSSYPLRSIIDPLCEYCGKAGLPSLQVRFVDEHLLDEYKAVPGRAIHATYYIDNSEYVYKTKDLLKLSGKINYDKRNKIKKYAGRQDVSVRPVTNGDINLCLDVQDEWCHHQNCPSCRSFFGCEKEAIKEMTAIFDDTFHRGLFLYINDELRGYLVGEKMSENLSFLYFAKSNVESGLVYLIYIMYRDHIKDVEYINADEDMGHEGLRRFKKQLSPYELWHKYIVTYSL